MTTSDQLRLIPSAYLTRRVDYCPGLGDCPICDRLEELFQRWDEEDKQ